MLYLVGSIILSSYLTVSFKLVERLNINTFQTIAFNYITCVITGSIVNVHFPLHSSIVNHSWFRWSLLMGATFIFLFNIIAFTAQKIGVSVASVANKLSLVIPFLFSIYLFHEKANIYKISGIAIALLAVYLTCYNKNSSDNKPAFISKKPFYLHIVPFLPVILFVGSGLLDTMIKFVEQSYLNAVNHNIFLIAAFAVAASIGIVILIVGLISGKQKFSYKSVVAGIAIAIPNYFSIWCLLKVLKLYAGKSSAIIPINNMGIVLFGTVVAWIAFHERLTAINWLGILFSIISIALIAFG